MSNLNLGISMAILVLFFIIIGIGYVYVDESRKNNQEARNAIIDAKEAITIVNKTQANFLEEWKEKQAIDNIRFNQTLDGLADTYDLIVDNQKLIINLTDMGSHSSQTNLNLTKFNRVALVDTNKKVTEIMRILNSSR